MCETPEWFCGLENVAGEFFDIGMSRKWVKFQFYMNYPFNIFNALLQNGYRNKFGHEHCLHSQLNQRLNVKVVFKVLGCDHLVRTTGFFDGLRRGGRNSKRERRA